MRWPITFLSSLPNLLWSLAIPSYLPLLTCALLISAPSAQSQLYWPLIGPAPSHLSGLSCMLPPLRSLPDFQFCTLSSPSPAPPYLAPVTLPITLDCNCPWTCPSPPLASKFHRGHDGELSHTESIVSGKAPGISENILAVQVTK